MKSPGPFGTLQGVQVQVLAFLRSKGRKMKEERQGGRGRLEENSGNRERAEIGADLHPDIHLLRNGNNSHLTIK